MADELKARGIPVVSKCTEQILRNPLPLTENDLVVGDFKWTSYALKRLGIAMPEPPDYPECLKHLLHRKIWSSTLGEVELYLQIREEDRPK